jgi:mRNA-degrading endonuclease RelE of RelBE toxin-antitoxin system
MRRLDTGTARRIHAAVNRYAATGAGDAKPLRDAGAVWRLRCGDWRVRFLRRAGAIHVLAVDHRSQAYR